MVKSSKNNIIDFIKNNIPSFVRGRIKKVYFKILYSINKHKFIKKGKFVEFRYRFRFECKNPFYANIGDKTIAEEFNFWNARNGNINVGQKCWFGLHNIVMGPVDIGNNVSTGPHVSILGPRHAHHNYDLAKTKKTNIGNNVWISTGSIIFSGVTIGDNAIIGPGSVVNKDVPNDAYVAGNPARNLTKVAEVTWKNQS